MRKQISIIIPVLNEEDVLSRLFDELGPILTAIESKYTVNAILIDDGSTDRSWHTIREVSATDSRVSGVRLSRNFGHQAALSCGLALAPGDAIVSMDADLQDPPSVILEMIEKWEMGAKVVLGIRRERRVDSVFKRKTAEWHYQLMRLISETPVIDQSGDFRLMDRSVVTAFNRLSERHRYIRGLVGWLGFQTDVVHYDRDARTAGQTKYPLFKMIRLAADAVVSLSSVPLRAAYAAALVLVIPFLLYLLYNVYLFYVRGVTMVPGWPSLILATILFGVFNLLMLGILGEYVGRIYTEVKRRPVFLADEICGTLRMNLP